MSLNDCYLENLSLVKVQHFLLEAIVAHRLHAHQTQNLDQWVLLSDAIFYVCVHLGSQMTVIFTTIQKLHSICSLLILANVDYVI